MGKLTDTLTIKRHLLEKIPFEFNLVADYDLSLYERPDSDRFARTIVARLRWWCIKNKIHTEVVAWQVIPKTWWDALKERFFPGWLLVRFPAEHIRVNTMVNHYHVCPHIKTDRHEDHLEFLTMEPCDDQYDAAMDQNTLQGRFL